MFSKLHQHYPFSPQFQLSRDSQTYEEETDSPNSAATTAPTTTTTAVVKSRQAQEPTTSGAGGGDGGSIEVVRRPRGRPPGSKNKPKSPVFITREPEHAMMSPYTLEVPGGNDVVEAISNFCMRKRIGICVLNGSGTVADVTLRQPSATPGSVITFHGSFNILSISATFLPQNGPRPPVPNMFAISLAGPQGQIVGGSVAGPLVAVGTVFLIDAMFNNPSYHRLPVEEEERPSVSAGGGGGEGHSPVGSSGGGGADSGHVAGGGGVVWDLYV